MMVTLKSRDGKKVNKTVEQAQAILSWCDRRCKGLWSLNDKDYEYSSGKLRKKTGSGKKSDPDVR